MTYHATMWATLVILISVHGVSAQWNLQRLRAAARATVGSSDFQIDKDNATFTREEFRLFLTTVKDETKKYVDKVIGPCQTAGHQDCSWNATCPAIDGVFHSFATNGRLHADSLIDALPAMFKIMTSPTCHNKDADDKTSHSKPLPTTGETWGYGIGFTSIVIVISNVGACLGPVMEKTFFQRLLQFLVAMGGGSLAATGVMVLIPEAFNLMAVEDVLGRDYIWKATVAVYSIYFFFILERLMKTLFYTRMVKKSNVAGTSSDSDDAISDMNMPLSKSGLENGAENSHGHSHAASTEPGSAPTLAWMVMAGDIIHNFVDGLAIGAAFSTDLSVGISVSLAVVCEELPHELADIAILLHSGFGIKKAVLVNFISACFIYLGLVVGIFLGSNIHSASQWIFALAGGLFLYIPLVDMLPEMSAHLDKEMKKGGSSARIVACLHVLGLTIGTGIILMIVNVAKFISV